MYPDDLSQTSRLHLACLDHGLFPSLGHRFLRHYLATFVDGQYSVAIAAERQGVIVGFLVGAVEPASHYRQVVRRHGWRLALYGAGALLMRPAVAWRFARTRSVRYLRGALRLGSGKVGVRANAPQAVLTHVAVLPAWRGQGIGTKLVQSFVEQCWSCGVPSVKLVTLAGSDGATGFYERLGWCRSSEYVDRDGLRWQTFQFEHSSEPS